MPGKSRSRSRSIRRRRQRGGEGEEETMVGMPAKGTDAPAAAPAMTGGRRSRRSGRKAKKGGEGIIATAALPFGLLALQRYFKGSRSTKKNVRGMGYTLKRTFRRRR